ncbi:hypothetical protein Q6258_28415, partial [Klebsiella pneumoniae]|nr:hypothetical protein [Klebsiella pneumoniae]
LWSRHPEHVAKVCGAQVSGVDRLQQVVGPVDAVINLAGAPIADRPWTHKRKALLWSSRIKPTENVSVSAPLREVVKLMDANLEE